MFWKVSRQEGVAEVIQKISEAFRQRVVAQRTGLRARPAECSNDETSVKQTTKRLDIPQHIHGLP
jgi:hypothetical protein